MAANVSPSKMARVRLLIRGSQRKAVKKAMLNLISVLLFDNRLSAKYGGNAKAFLFAAAGNTDPAFLNAQGVINRLSGMLNAKALIGVVGTNANPPTVVAASPGVGPAAGGTAVTLTGVNFTGATQVVFDTLIAPVFTVINDTTIQVTTPPHVAGSVNVFVEGPQGASFPTSTSVFTYQ